MCPSLIEIGSKTAEKNSAQTNKQTNRHYQNNGYLAVNQYQSDERNETTLKYFQNVLELFHRFISVSFHMHARLK